MICGGRNSSTRCGVRLGLKGEIMSVYDPSPATLAKLAKRLACFNVVEALRGFNNSTQYIGGLSYKSVVTGQDESIKVEFSIREPILEPVEHLPARTLLVDPFRQVPVVAPVEVPVLSCRETYAEKLRAALTRREPAIRDFYDIDHGVRSGRLSTNPDSRAVSLTRCSGGTCRPGCECRNRRR